MFNYCNNTPEEKFTKITPVNGFDKENPDNAKQNNYAWSMEELGDYIYVGTGRNLFINVFKGIVENIGIDIKLPDILIPENEDNAAEIWRYKKDGSEDWTRVFKAQDEVEGIRFMKRYTSPDGETAIYAGGSTGYIIQDDECDNTSVAIYKTTNGYDWEQLNTDIEGSTIRSMIIHRDKLYISVLDDRSMEDFGARIYVSTNPEYDGWDLVTKDGDSDKNPTSGVVVMESFNNRLYAATGGEEGFELWRTNGVEPKQNEWTKVIDKGAGDALNQGPLTLGVYKDHLYVGAIYSPFDINLRYGFFKPFDLIRIDKCDRWELVVGGKPFEPTNPETGVREKSLSGWPSGFANPFNLYCWQLQEHKGEFYLGTFDWSVLILPILAANISTFTKDLPGGYLLKGVLDYISKQTQNPSFNVFRGFDMFKSSDGVNWEPVTLDGLGNPYNYGLRKIFSSEDGHLYLGTANVFEGLEIWKK